ncbi:MAG TPA: carboxylating nicotinate-nucleotide diphosphorylase [Syntrophomonadaceae bacterium]|nr:carboxylating nicotinate-nucleotide diphosphorylase [Syntrophomonadaceae bacterium]
MQYLGLRELVTRALDEDLGYRDITSVNIISPEQKAQGIFLAKSPGIVAGLEVCQEIFSYLDPGMEFQVFIPDGHEVKPGDQIARVGGQTLALLEGERVALNFLQRLSGIATRTRTMADLIKDYKAQLLDTRKTTPGLRVIEKYAVRVGGGRNHRFGLFDGVMIKDNHIQVAGGISSAVAAVRQRVPHTIKIEVEAENLDQVSEALQAGADIILLDNMDVDTLCQAVKIIGNRALSEASGGIDEESIQAVAATGVDYISVGALTHSVKSLDISFEVQI